MLHLDAGARVHQVPIRETHVGEGVGDGLAQIDVRDVAVDLADLQLAPLRVDAQPSEQRLGVGQRNVARVARVEAEEDVVGFGASVVPGERVASPIPLDGLLDPEVRVSGVGVDRLLRQPARPVELGPSRADGLAEVEGRAEVRQEDGIGLGDGQVFDLRVEPLDGDVQVLIERPLDRVVHREIEDAVSPDTSGRDALLDQLDDIQGHGLGSRITGRVEHPGCQREPHARSHNSHPPPL